MLCSFVFFTRVVLPDPTAVALAMSRYFSLPFTNAQIINLNQEFLFPLKQSAFRWPYL